MKNSPARLALLSGVSSAAAIFLLPATAQAQTTTCSQLGTTITCVDGAVPVLTATTTANTSTVAGPGLVTSNITDASTTTYVANTTGTGTVTTNAGVITTTGLGSTGHSAVQEPAQLR